MKEMQSTLGWPVPMLASAAVAGFITLVVFMQPTPASADDAKYYLDCPTTEVREGDTFRTQRTGTDGQ